MTALAFIVALLWVVAVVVMFGAAVGRPPRLGAALFAVACALAAHALPIVTALWR